MAVSRLLGHEREDVTRVYLGSAQKVQRTPKLVDGQKEREEKGTHEDAADGNKKTSGHIGL